MAHNLAEIQSHILADSISHLGRFNRTSWQIQSHTGLASGYNSGLF